MTSRTAATPGSPLTDREIRVLEAISHGASDVEIAELLDLGVDAVKTALRCARVRLNARDRGHAACVALRRGLIA